MTDPEWQTFWAEFAPTINREAAIPIEDRIRVAVTAGLRALEPDNLREERARRIIEAVADAHDTTPVDIRSSSRVAEVVAAREECAFELARAGFDWRSIAPLLGRTSNSIVGIWIKNHEARVAAAGAIEEREAAHGA